MILLSEHPHLSDLGGEKKPLVGATTWTRGGCQTTDTTGKNSVVSLPPLTFENFLIAIPSHDYHGCCHICHASYHVYLLE